MRAINWCFRSALPALQNRGDIAWDAVCQATSLSYSSRYWQTVITPYHNVRCLASSLVKCAIFARAGEPYRVCRISFHADKCHRQSRHYIASLLWPLFLNNSIEYNECTYYAISRPVESSNKCRWLIYLCAGAIDIRHWHFFELRQVNIIITFHWNNDEFECLYKQ